jgi:ABC-type glycerol-3-phosphate transport system substrate-binding protein
MVANDNGLLTTTARVGIVCGGLVIAVASILAVAPAPMGEGCLETSTGPGLHRQSDYWLHQFLGLSEGQHQAWIGAWRAHFDGVRPTLEQVQDLRAQLQAELASGSPDAATVGGYVIEIRELAATIGAARGQLDATLSEILDRDQQTRYEALRASGRNAG